MSAYKQNLVIEQGATFSFNIEWREPDGTTPVDLTGYTAEMDIRATYDDLTTIIQLDTTNGRITLGGTAGTVQLSISATDTAALSFESAVYDLELTAPDGTVTRLMEGGVSFSPEVTR